MKIVWKPLDLMGLRLYKVVASWPAPDDGSKPSSRTYHTVFADSPTGAAKVVKEQYKDLPEDRRPYCVGKALNVCQPAEWYERSAGCVSPCDCKHERSRTICSGRGCGDGNNWREHVSICQDCGQISVSATKEGVHFEVEFGLCCDDDLRAAARYMRGEAAAAEAVRLAKKGDDAAS